jgi:hypothetical protein
MKTLDLIKKTREYLDYIEEHVLNVHKAWDELKEKCKDMRFMFDDFHYFTVQDAIENHDYTKLSQEEFVPYRQYFFTLKDECKNKESFEKAWEHHKNNNPHHWEEWTKNIGKTGYPNEWEFHCVHMVCDWMAMGYKFGDTAQSYYEKNKDKIEITDKYAIEFIYEIFKRIK